MFWKRIIGATVLASSLTACGVGGNIGPAHVDTHLYHLVAAGHYRRAARHIDFTPPVTRRILPSADPKKSNALLVFVLTEMRGIFRKRGGLQRVIVLSRSVHGDRAHVKVRIDFGNGRTRVSNDAMVRKNGRWFVVMRL